MARSPVVGVDLGGTKLLAGVVDRDLNVLHRVLRPARVGSEEEIVEAIIASVEECVAAAPEVAGVGVGVPCTIDQRRGVAVQAVNLPLTDVPLRDILIERIHRPSFIDNDANVAALAEVRHGAARGATEMIMLTIGTGIGGGIVIGGQLYRGSVGAAAELGHMVVNAHGPPCQGNCPNHGCLEAMASGTALARYGTDAARRAPESALGRALAADEAITGRLVVELAQRGDPLALAALRTAGGWLGLGLANYANIFDPELIVVGGGVMSAGELLLGPARECVRDVALPPNDEIPIVPARFGADAGLIGSATLAFEELERTG